MSSNKEWENYEIVVQKLINKLDDVKTELKLGRIEGKRKMRGASGEEWEIDIIAYDSTDGKPVLVECKHWNRKVTRDILATLVYKIRDVGSDRGIIVTTSGLQEGAKRIADTENVDIIILKRGSSIYEFDLVLPTQSRHHVGLHGVVKFKDEVKIVNISKKKKESE